MADTADLKSASFGSTGSSPVPDTSYFSFYGKKKSKQKKNGLPYFLLQKKVGKENFWGILTVFFSFGSVPDIG